MSLRKTTAQLRSEARSAEERQDHEAAAALYDQAADRYPGNIATSAHAQADIQGLRTRAGQCRAFAAYQKARAEAGALILAAGCVA